MVVVIVVVDTDDEATVESAFTFTEAWSDEADPNATACLARGA